MPARLSELLERIRPAGTPGAPSEGEQQRLQFDHDHEIAEIVRILVEFEKEADAIVAAANDQAASLAGDAERQARQIRSGLPDQLAKAQVAVTHAHDERGTAEQRSIEAEKASAVLELNARAATLIPELQDAAMNIIWSIVPPDASSRDDT